MRGLANGVLPTNTAGQDVGKPVLAAQVGPLGQAGAAEVGVDHQQPTLHVPGQLRIDRRQLPTPRPIAGKTGYEHDRAVSYGQLRENRSGNLAITRIDRPGLVLHRGSRLLGRNRLLDDGRLFYNGRLLDDGSRRLLSDDRPFHDGRPGRSAQGRSILELPERFEHSAHGPDPSFILVVAWRTGRCIGLAVRRQSAA